MGKAYTEIDDGMQRWMAKQQMFFVATAPLDGNGHVNCSPKGLDSLRVLGPRTLGYVDLGGSGIETVAHVKENQRIVIMMCAFAGPPKIFRFYGRGSVVEPYDEGFADLLVQFPAQATVRNFVIIEVEEIFDSCGYGVPNYAFLGQRESLTNYYDQQTEAEIVAYRRKKNSQSLDGLPGLQADTS